MADDLIRRYCGLAWSGGADETWAYRYFETISDAAADRVTPTDVLVAAAIHPSLRRSDLSWFWDNRQACARVLREIPDGVDLAEVSAGIVEVLQTLPERFGGEFDVSLLTKVLHRKRPRLVPMLDRALVDRYRSGLPTRGRRAWPQLVAALRSDLHSPSNAALLGGIGESLEQELAVVPSRLRLLDIAIWMEARTRNSKRSLAANKIEE
jgi:hypothetical protein